jgi:hypothetical protein
MPVWVSLRLSLHFFRKKRDKLSWARPIQLIRKYVHIALQRFDKAIRPDSQKKPGKFGINPKWYQETLGKK